MQTWVDNTGAYLDFVGGWLGDRMVLLAYQLRMDGRPLGHDQGLSSG